MPTLTKSKLITRRRNSVSVEQKSQGLEHLDDLEDTVWELQEQLFQLCDEVESLEPLQARQTYDLIKIRMRAVEDYITAIQSPEETNNAT